MDAGTDFFGGGGLLLEDSGNLGHMLSQGIDVILDPVQLLRDLFGRRMGMSGRFADFFRHYAEAAPYVSGPGASGILEASCLRSRKAIREALPG